MAARVGLLTLASSSAFQQLPVPARPRLRAHVRCAEDGDDLLGGIVKKEENPYVTSKADRLRAAYGEQVVSGRGGRANSRQVEEILGKDLEAFKASEGLSGRTLAGGAAGRDDDGAELTLLQNVIQVLGTVLTFNFFIIICFFTWFMAGVVGQFGLHDETVINAFRASWDGLILPLLTTHMALTLLSAGLEKLAGSA
jgi:hypothetical protein